MTEYHLVEGLPPEPHTAQILALCEQVFGEPTSTPLDQKPGLLVNYATHGDDVVGFKIGYERKPRHFYSWMGAVVEDHRGQGIGSELMRRQHEHLRTAGNVEVRTQTMNRYRAMLLLNIRHGFDIVGLVADGTDDPKIVLVKRLN